MEMWPRFIIFKGYFIILNLWFLSVKLTMNLHRMDHEQRTPEQQAKVNNG